MCQEVIVMTQARFTDQLSDFDMRQFLLLEEGISRHRSALGKAEARRRAASEMSPAFDVPALDAAARAGDLMLPSTLATVLGGLSRRADWPDRRAAFTGPARDAHLAEARLRAAVDQVTLVADPQVV
jgi:hypothetical protein